MSSNEYNKKNKKLKHSWFIRNPIQNIVKRRLTHKSRKNNKKIEQKLIFVQVKVK